MRYYEYKLPGEDEIIITKSIRNYRFPPGTIIRAVVTDRDGYIINSWRIPLTREGRPILRGRSLKSHKSKYSYAEALRLVEEVMQKTHIRKYCMTVCKGRCCQSCRDHACLNGQRKLHCSIFICSDLEIVFSGFPCQYYYIRYRLEERWVKQFRTNPYYDPLPQEVNEKCKLPRHEIDSIIKIFKHRRIQNIMRYLIRHKIDLIKLREANPEKYKIKFRLLRRRALKAYRERRR